MSLIFYNTASRRKEEFRPLEEGKVHARSAIVFDVLVRYLRAKGFNVTYVRNFTDVDDKIIKKANELGKDTTWVAEYYIKAFYEDMEQIGVLKADVEPRATEHIGGMIEMVQTLLAKGYAYVEGGDVYFSVEKFEDYGRLSGRKLEDMQAGSRIAVDERKRHPMDFALWKAAKPGEPQWDSPWGPGRPGWHIECSVMSNHYPHHENERAQSIAANGGRFANFWIHNGFVTVESEKMSKSLGNFITIRDALAEYHPEVLRLFLLSKHYRSPVDFSEKAVGAIQSGLVRIYRTLERMEEAIGPGPTAESMVSHALLEGSNPSPFLARFEEVMDDDLNTAGAVGLMFEKVREINKLLDSFGTGTGEKQEMLRVEREDLLRAGAILGLLQRTPKRFFEELPQKMVDIDPSEIQRLIAQRAEARAKKDWATADKIRDQLKAKGVVLEDGPEGTTWRLDV
ncbi:MAG: cysteine--tRNA ligase [Deltaproteobacteria bacterium]|nr:cysteine--tRNA ligase [Deltaproteobacteria bacterium]